VIPQLASHDWRRRKTVGVVNAETGGIPAVAAVEEAESGGGEVPAKQSPWTWMNQ